MPSGHLFSFQTQLQKYQWIEVSHLSARSALAASWRNWESMIGWCFPVGTALKKNKLPKSTPHGKLVKIHVKNLHVYQVSWISESSPPELRQHRHLPELPLWHALLNSGSEVAGHAPVWWQRAGLANSWWLTDISQGIEAKLIWLWLKPQKNSETFFLRSKFIMTKISISNHRSINKRENNIAKNRCTA